MTVAEAARKLGVTLDCVYRNVKAGKIAATINKGRYNISEQAIKERLATVASYRERMAPKQKAS